MRKLLGLVVIFLSLICSCPSFAGDLKDAVSAIEKIQSMVKVGVTNRDYGLALPNMESAIKNYVRSESSDSEVSDVMEKTGKKYLRAKEVWDTETLAIKNMLELARLRRTGSHEDRLSAIDLQADAEIRSLKINEKITPIWAEASNDIEKLLEMIKEKKLKW